MCPIEKHGRLVLPLACHLPGQVANGYLVGACLAHYYPGKLDSEEFNRGNSPAHKAANWEFVQKFMKRRGYGLHRQDMEILCMVRARPVSRLPPSVESRPRCLLVVEMDILAREFGMISAALFLGDEKL